MNQVKTEFANLDDPTSLHEYLAVLDREFFPDQSFSKQVAISLEQQRQFGATLLLNFAIQHPQRVTLQEVMIRKLPALFVREYRVDWNDPISMLGLLTVTCPALYGPHFYLNPGFILEAEKLTPCFFNEAKKSRDRWLHNQSQVLGKKASKRLHIDACLASKHQTDQKALNQATCVRHGLFLFPSKGLVDAREVFGLQTEWARRDNESIRQSSRQFSCDENC